jgi:SAM-dependent methyltransferase
MEPAEDTAQAARRNYDPVQMQAEPQPEAPRARYDEHADWYDERLAVPFRDAGAEVLGRLLGRGDGRCLDLCCGTGIHFDALAALGWRISAVDLSRDQLRIAAGRAAGLTVEVIRADAGDLPFDDDAFDAVVSFFSHTDVDDFAAVVKEAVRVLRPPGVFVYVGIHPCFIGPHAVRGERAVPILHPGYDRVGRYSAAPGILPDGLWTRVSGVHLPLAKVVQPFLDAGLSIDRFEEHGEEDYPRWIALRARGLQTSASSSTTS